MAEVDAKALHRLAPETARILCLAWLEEATQALDRLHDPADEEALHDLRVSLRRLRSTLRAYRPHLKGSSPRKMRRRLRDLAAATNAGRDAEVQIAWLQGRSARLTPEERPGVEALIARLEEERDRVYADARQRIAAEFTALLPRLVKRLSSYRAQLDEIDTASRSFLRVTSELVTDHTERLRALLAEVRTPHDQAQAHAARIAAKRLRYIVEPIRSAVPGAKRLVKDLKGLQDVIGELHDVHVLAGKVAAAGEAAAARRARRLHQRTLDSQRGESGSLPEEEPGLLALTRQLAAERDELFQRLRDRWLDEAASAFYRRAADLAARMSRGATGAMQRRYLLDRLPENLKGQRGLLIEQGWLPGEEIEERLRRTRGRDGVSFYRTVKSGSGLTEVELEERVSRGTFRKLWPLTEGRRVRLRRYRTAEGEQVWEIDAFLDRDLFLAEVELPPPDVEPTIPAWLAPHLRREVTGRKEFGSREIARRKSARRKAPR